MNNRIMAMLFALVAAMFISIVPVKAEAATTCKHPTTVWQKDAMKHRKYCTSCGEDIVKEAVHTNELVYFEKDATNHTVKCLTCGYTADVKHEPINDNGVCRCSKCRKLLEHSYELVTSDTHHAKKCSVCETVVERAEHDWTSTNDGNGKHTKVCGVCKKTVTEDHVDSTTDKDCVCDACGAADILHSPVPVGAKAATCTEPGNIAYRKCEFCGKLFAADSGAELKAEDVVTTLKHNPAEEWKLTEDKTQHYHECQNDGCKDKLSLGAHEKEWQYNDIGYHWEHCKVCGYDFPGVEHTFSFVANEGQFTHTRKCTVCEKEEKTVACVDEDGDHKCDDCGGSKLHDYNDGYMGEVIYKKVTCTEDGIKTHKECTVCGMNVRPDNTVMTDAELVNKTEGHDFEWNHNNDGHWQKCKNCDEATELVPHDASAYTYVAGEYQHTLNCATCGRGSSAYKLACVDKDDDCSCDLCGGMMWHTRADMTYHSSTKATCTTAGRVGHFSCNTCGKLFEGSDATGFKLFTESTVREPLGHDLYLVGATSSGQHQMKCKREGCAVYVSKGHFSEDGDCICDVPDCEMPAHSHTFVQVLGKAATCTEDGVEAYNKYAGCGRMFDLNNTEITEPVTIPATGHKASSQWVAAENGKHVKKCTTCGEAVESEDHVFVARNVTCSVCGAEEGLTHVAAKAATCTESGNVEYWCSKVTGKMYADAAGTKQLTSVTIPATGHNMSGWENAGDGLNHKQVCMNNGCNHELTEAHKGSNGCFCTECYGELNGHELNSVAMVAATCSKAGTQAHYKCSCGKLYDLGYNLITAPKAIAQLKHDVTDAKVQKDTKEDKHYVACNNCGYRFYENHVMDVEDPMKGNYHQRVCECGELEIEQHYDKNGDNKCDVCNHSLTSTTAADTNVQQHDSVTVYTGDSDTVKSTQSWWQNWLEVLTPGNSGGASSTEKTVVDNGNTGSNATTGNTGSNANTGNTGSGTITGGSSNSGSTGNTGSTAAETNVIMQFINWFLGLFGF